MCGIYGYIGNSAIEEVKSKLIEIAYRGPDYSCVIKEGNNVFLGHNRLAIIDIDSRSNQPFYYGDLVIVFNGEIYNYIELRSELKRYGCNFRTNSDTEVICAAYTIYGDHCLEKLNGMFSFVIYDRKVMRLFGARDRLGKKPLFYRFNSEGFEFASQISPILKGLKVEVNWNNVNEYFFWGYNQGSNTIFKDVFKLKPGHYFHYDIAKWEFVEKAYWDLTSSYSGIIYSKFDEVKEYLSNLIADAVRIRMISDVPLGVFLSGGVDSSLVAAVSQKISNSQIKTFSISFTEQKYDESRFAKEIANYLGTDHYEIKCSITELLKYITNLKYYMDEPLADPSYLPCLLLFERARSLVTVGLSGDGGDEIFIGYDRYNWIDKVNNLMNLPYKFRSIFAKVLRAYPNYRVKLIASGLNQRSLFDLYAKMVGNIKENWLGRYNYDNEIEHWNEGISLPRRMADFDISTYLNNDINTKVDRSSMRFSLEPRSPLMDYRIVEFSRSIPLHFMFKRDNQKLILKDILSSYIPNNYFNRPKAGFAVPLKEWFRGELKEFVLDTVCDSQLESIPSINKDSFRALVDDHMMARSNNSLEIWKVIVFLQMKDRYKF